MSLFKKLFGSKSIEEPVQETKEENAIEAFKKVPWMTDLRLENISTCLNSGFRPATSLPTEYEKELRPALEIAQRLNAIKAQILWLMIPEEHLESEKISTFIETNSLKEFMSEEEQKTFDFARDDQQARNAIGWKFENAWPLAWYFGYKEPEITGEMMTGEQMKEILESFCCPLDQSLTDWIADKETISKDALVQREDLFYCLHNAVRSGQMGKETVPAEFDLMGSGGVIHERRHSLTWMLSNGKKWEDTELST